MGLWDTAGQERYQSLTPTTFKDAQAILICFDLTNMESFENVQNWLKKVEKHSVIPNVIKLIVGLKADLMNEREVSSKDAAKLAEKAGSHYFECSSKDGYNIEELFQLVGNTLFQISETGGFNQVEKSDRIKIDTKKSGKRKRKAKCC